MNTIPELLESDRVMVLAPHPDDETLAAGIVLQQASAVGAAVQVVFATAGEANPWPQRWIERRWHLDASDRQRWGARRSEEARQALRRLGIDPSAAVFLGWQDGGIVDLLIADGDRASGQLAALIAAFRPTRIVLPCIRDRHPDHWALHLLTRAALLGLGDSPLLLTFLVHAHEAVHAALEYRQLPAEPAQLTTKLAALDAHQTQLRLSRGWLQHRARSPETFALTTRDGRPNAAVMPAGSGIRLLPSDGGRAQLLLDATHPAARPSGLSLLLASVSPGHVDLWRCASDRAGVIALTDCRKRTRLGEIAQVRDGKQLRLTLPCPLPGTLWYARFARSRRWLQVIDRDMWVRL